MEIQIENSKLAKISAHVSCGSFVAVMLGTTAAMANTFHPEDTMIYGSVGMTADNDRFKFDLNDDGTDDFKISDNGSKGYIEGLKVFYKGLEQEGKIADRLFEAGETIDNTANFDKDQTIYAPFSNLGLEVGETAFLGLRLEFEEFGFRYGWVEVTRGSLTAGSIGFQTLEDIGAPIPPVPLPASLPLLALGVGGLAALRRKRKAA